MREDYIMRIIKQLGDALRRIRGLSSKRDYSAALDAVHRAWADILDVPRELVEVIDTPTLAAMLRDPERMRLAAELLVEEARALAGKHDPVHAAIAYRRAMELYLEARAIEPSESDDTALLELSRFVHANQLDPRYRS